MTPSHRAAVLTLVLVLLSGVGIEWNKHITVADKPVAYSDSTSAKESVATLKLDVANPTLSLGQIQEITVTSAPNTAVIINTTYPSGAINNAGSVKAVTNEKGEYAIRFKIGDIKYVGQYRVDASLADGGAKITKYFVAKLSVEASPTATNYLYPLIP